MAISKTAVNLIGTQAVPTSIAFGASSTSSGVDVSTYVGILIGMEVVYGATPDGNTKLEVQTSPDNTNWDTVAWAEFEIDYSAGLTLMKSIRIGPEAKYIRVKATNGDSADSVTVWAYAVEMGV